MATETKAQLLRRIRELEIQLAAVRNAVGIFDSPWHTWIPCGKVEKVYGHPFEDQIRNDVTDQWDGTLHREREDAPGIRDGWMIVKCYELPYEALCVRVQYTDEDGTMAWEFCPVATVTKTTREEA